jgi:Holliday junction resolvase RusA-like endonuclease
MRSYKFPINPVAASRPRVSKFGAYFTGPYKKFRSAAAIIINRILGRNFTPMSGKLAVDIKCFVTRPKTTKLEYPRADVDNYSKAILDSLNGKLWDDDSQIIALFISKQWADCGEEGYFIVDIEEIKVEHRKVS